MGIQGRFWDGLVAFAAIASEMTAEATTRHGSGCYDPWIGDAVCDLPNNKAACDYDGGDCCECTCVDATSNDTTCGGEGFACVDPDAPCAEDDDVTSINTSGWSMYNKSFARGSFSYTISNCIDYYSGDGHCDLINNEAACQYDGGDCCSCTCVDADYPCDDYGGSACVDPNAPCVDDDDYKPVYKLFRRRFVNPKTGCIDSYIGDGFCDPANNQVDCQFDGGDCCGCTCTDAVFLCDDYGGSACIDPNATCVDDDDYTPGYNLSSWWSADDTIGCIDSYIGDGFCDIINNHAHCQYDGGDCCSCTCVDAEYPCDDYGGSRCVDPKAHCGKNDKYTPVYNSFSWWSSSSSECVDTYIGDGFCDSTNNHADCQFDGGDCCSCTCIDGQYTCGMSGYNCEDPEAPCLGEDESLCILSSSGDGECDEINNREECDYDGGDCCEISCKDAKFTCGLNGYNCSDPAVVIGGNYPDYLSSAKLPSSAEQHVPTYVLTVFIIAIGALIHALG